MNERTMNNSKKTAKVKVFSGKKKQPKPEKDFITELKNKYEEDIDLSNVKTFSDFPLSPKTIKGLKSMGFYKPTEIQRETLMVALKGNDILGAAQTGSGKTLAFVIPVLEKLFCEQWTHLDGLGALVITPTRELAYQIFEMLRHVGMYHDFSAALVIGGKDLKFERNRIGQCNIIVCTPGRLLQHMDENPLFDAANLQILVLDEADRCLDMGFEPAMNAIISNLPLKRQTLLFSATQTKSVKDLARLSLKDPSYIAVHENAKHSTPSGLQQSYVVCELKDKVSILWSFIRNNLKKKSIIFMSSCKQVKYIFEIFSKLRPGISLLALYGTLHQLRRMEIYESFTRKSAAVLIATDLAARGLDFPEVNWVVQADCPEDSATYVHRVGRTARYHKGGESLLLLLPSELAILEELENRKIPINKIEMNPMKINNPVRKMEAYLASSPALKETAKRAFVAYAKAIVLMKNKKVFKIEELDTDSYAHSLGLAIPPRIRFLQKMNAKKSEKANKKQFSTTKNREYDADETPNEYNELNTGEAVMEFKDNSSQKFRHQTDVLNLQDRFMTNEDEEDLLTVKRKDHDIEIPVDMKFDEISSGSKSNRKPITKAAMVKKILKKNIVPNMKITFDASGEALQDTSKQKKSDIAQLYENEDVGGIDIEKAKLVLREEDKFDRKLFREKVKAKNREKKRKLKEKSDEFDECSSEGEAPDTSWLPDPDNVYGRKESEDLNENQRLPSKRRSETNSTEQRPPKKKQRKLKEVQKLNSDLSVNEAEELALMLLKK